MQHFIQFVQGHWFMVGIFVILLIFMFWEEAKAKGVGSSLKQSEAIRMINSEHALVLDIRSTNDFEKGHIAGAMNIPEAEVLTSIKRLEKYKSKPVILVCMHGQKAGALATKLKKLGFASAQALAGGTTEWNRSGMPLIKGK